MIYDRDIQRTTLTITQNPNKRILELLVFNFKRTFIYTRSNEHIKINHFINVIVDDKIKELDVIDVSFLYMRVRLDYENAPLHFKFKVDEFLDDLDYVLDKSLSEKRSKKNKRVSIYRIQNFSIFHEQAFLSRLSQNP